MQQGMTPEQKAGLMQLMGQTYGEAHKNDQMIIGKSGNLSPSSQQLKNQFEDVARTPTVNQQQMVPPPHAPPPAQPAPPEPIQQVTPEQAAREIATTHVEPVNPQVEFDFSEPSKTDIVIDLLKKQNLILKEISLKLDNGKNAKGTKQK